MFCDAIDEYEVNFFTGSSDLNFHMGKISFVLFPFINQGHFHFAFSATAQFCSKRLFIMEQQFAFRNQLNHVVLSHGVRFEEHLVIIIAAVHDENGLSEKSFRAVHGGECDIVNWNLYS